MLWVALHIALAKSSHEVTRSTSKDWTSPKGFQTTDQNQRRADPHREMYLRGGFGKQQAPVRDASEQLKASLGASFPWGAFWTIDLNEGLSTTLCQCGRGRWGRALWQQQFHSCERVLFVYCSGRYNSPESWTSLLRSFQHSGPWNENTKQFPYEHWCKQSSKLQSPILHCWEHQPYVATVADEPYGVILSLPTNLSPPFSLWTSQNISRCHIISLCSLVLWPTLSPL